MGLVHGREGWALPGGRPPSFHVSIEKISRRLDFEFEFTDTAHVVGRRHIVIQPGEDIGPEVELRLAVVRKTGEDVNKVTPSAMVPFEGWVRDDHGLAQVQYEFAYQSIEGAALNRERALLVAG